MHGVSYFPIPVALQQYFATLHRAEFRAGKPITLPAILGQVWFCKEPMWWRPPGSKEILRLPSSALIGFTSRCFEVSVEQDAVLYGCGFWPLGWAELVRRPASELVDKAVDAAELWPKTCAQWQEEGVGRESRQWGEALVQVASSITSGTQPSPDAGRIAIIDSWLNSDAGPAALALLLGLSPRQAERVTARTHGGSPRLLAGKWRALRAASEMDAAQTDEGGKSERYADQSHLIREFRRFIGSTPKPFRAHHSIAKRIVADDWHLESNHPLALAHRK